MTQVSKFARLVQNLHQTQVCNLIAEYMQEADRNGMLGFTAQDVHGINRLLHDLMGFMHDECNYNAHVRAWGER